jgi:hypothetical protein
MQPYEAKHDWRLREQVAIVEAVGVGLYSCALHLRKE